MTSPNPWHALGWLLVFSILSFFAALVHRFGFGVYFFFAEHGASSAQKSSAFREHLDSGTGLAIFYLLQFSLIVPAVIEASALPGQSWRQTLALHPVAPGTVLRWLGIWVLFIIAQGLLVSALHLQGEPFMQDMAAKANPALFLVAVILAPIMEESIFRGYLFKALRPTRLGFTGTMVLTTAIFALLHTQYQGPGLLVVAGLGILNTLARERTGSLLVPIILHMAQNSLALAGTLLAR